MSVRVGVKFDGETYQVVVENPSIGYKFMGKTFKAKALMPYPGETSYPSGGAHEEARQRAIDDAKDWAVKFLAADIKCDVVETLT